MSDYLLTIVGTVLFSSVIVAILPNGKTAELIKAIVRTACLAVILSPVATILVDVKNNDGIFVESSIDLHQSFIEYSCKRRIEETEAVLKQELDGRFDGIYSVTVDWEWQTVASGGYSVNEICVTNIQVQTEDSFSEKKSLQEYLLKNYGCKCSIITLSNSNG